MRRKIRILPVLTGLTVLTVFVTDLASTAYAADDNAVEETVIVASRTPTAAQLTGVSVTVVDRAAIDQLAYPDMADLLDAQVGVSVTQTGGLGGVANVRIRGEEGFRTRVVLDGIDLADPSSPQISPRFEHLLTDGVERVEILRGPQGLLWGADAGGVISISSRLPIDGVAGLLAIEHGGQGFQRWSAGFSAGSEDAGFAAQIGRLSNEGINARTDDVTLADADGYDNTTARITAGIKLGRGFRLSGSVIDIEGENEFDGCFDVATFGTSNDCNDAYAQRAWRLAMAHSGARHSIEAAVSDASTDRIFFTNGIQGFTAEGSTAQRALTGSFMATDTLRLAYGVEHSDQAFNDGFNSRQRDNVGVYGELMHSWTSGSLSVSGRHDDNDDFGTFASWRLAVTNDVMLADQSITVRAAAGTGFRAPSLYEVAYNQSASAFPPASMQSLQAEEGEGWEVAMATQLGRTRIEVVGFSQQIDNAIAFDLAGFSGYLQEPGTIESRGVEAVVQSQLTDGLSLDANAMWNDTENETGQQRAYRPEWTSRVSLLWAAERWSGTLTARRAMNRVDPTGTKIDDTLTIDAVARWPLANGITLSARAENLSDDDAQQISPFNVPGRTWFIGASYAL